MDDKWMDDNQLVDDKDCNFMFHGWYNDDKWII
jgi:hypothetical protein